MGVICRASQSPVGEEGEGKGGRQGLLLIFRIFQFSWSCCKFALQSWPGVSWYVHCVRLYPPPRQASRASSSFSVFFFSRHQRFHSGFLQPRKPKNCTEGHLQSVVSSLRLNTLGTDLKHFIISRISVTISHSIISATNNVFFYK